MPSEKYKSLPGCKRPLSIGEDVNDESWPSRFFSFNPNGEIRLHEANVTPAATWCGISGADLKDEYAFSGADCVFLCHSCCVKYGLKW